MIDKWENEKNFNEGDNTVNTMLNSSFAVVCLTHARLLTTTSACDCKGVAMHFDLSCLIVALCCSSLPLPLLVSPTDSKDG